MATDDGDDPLRMLMETAPVGIQIYHLDDPEDPGSFRCVANTPGALEAAGVTADEMPEIVGKTFREFVPQFLDTGYPETYRQVILTGDPRTVEFAYGDDRLPTTIWLSHAWRLKGRYLGLHFQNVTHRRRVERMLDAKLAELERSNAELDRFAAAASHDLQEPLRTIASFADLLVRDHAEHLDEKGTRYLDYVQKGAARLQLVLDGLLEYARIPQQSQSPARTDVGDIIAAARENLVRQFEDSGAELEVGEMPTIEADPVLLTLLFQNLLANSLRFAGDQPARIEAHATREDDVWRFTVRDHGIGFDPEYASRIFQMFRRLHSPDSYPGTGIGLASAKKIVEHHGGKIWADSQPGEGATFYFTLPEKRSPV